MSLFVHISDSLLVTTCSLSSNSTYSLKCEKGDAGLDVIKLQNLEELFILVTAFFENSFKISRMLRPMEVKKHLMTPETKTTGVVMQWLQQGQVTWVMIKLLGRYPCHNCCIPGVAA